MRTNRLWPTSSSSARTCRLMADWVTLSSRAASVKLRCRAVASKARRDKQRGEAARAHVQSHESKSSEVHRQIVCRRAGACVAMSPMVSRRHNDMNLYAASVALLWTTAMHPSARVPRTCAWAAAATGGAHCTRHGQSGTATAPWRRVRSARSSGAADSRTIRRWQVRAALIRSSYWSVTSVSMNRRPSSGSTDSRLDRCSPWASVRLKPSSRSVHGRARSVQ